MTGLYDTPIEAEAALPLRRNGEVLSYARYGLNCRRLLQVVLVGRDPSIECRVPSLLDAELALHRASCKTCARLHPTVAILH